MSTLNAVPVVNLRVPYITGLFVSYATGTTLTVSAGQCSDSGNVFDMVLPNAITINAALNGLNGLDTGSLAANKIYSIFLVSDPVTGLATGAVLSLSTTTPFMPFVNGVTYSVYKRIGWVYTDSGAAFFLRQLVSGSNLDRMYMIDSTPLALNFSGTMPTSAGTANTVDLTGFIPSLGIATNLWLFVAWGSNTSGDALYIFPTGFGGTTAIYQPATSATTDPVPVLMMVGADRLLHYYATRSSDTPLQIKIIGFMDHL